MLRDVITLPVRIGLRATRLGFRLTEHVIALGLRTTGRLIESVLPREAGQTPQEPTAAQGFELDLVVATVPAPAPTPARKEPQAVARPRRRTTQTERNGRIPAPVAPAPPEEPTLPEAAPVHISTEPEFVESFAEAGAEEGAGAAVHVDEPWEGYARMPAGDVIARLGEASAEELAVVELYEGMHRRRKTVLRAAQRELQRSRAAAHP